MCEQCEQLCEQRARGGRVGGVLPGRGARGASSEAARPSCSRVEPERSPRQRRGRCACSRVEPERSPRQRRGPALARASSRALACSGRVSWSTAAH